MKWYGYHKRFYQGEAALFQRAALVLRHYENGSNYQPLLDALVDAGRADDASWLLTQFGPTSEISGARQSNGAHALWRSLGTSYPLVCVEIRDKVLRYLGNDLGRYLKDDLHTRLVLIGAGSTAAQVISGLGPCVEHPV
ncbi:MULTISPECIES: hypothetical protein [unclassified Massilia]|uniref:hypothetical protein n=1 Tax=unclassified Massilia TaxID=2609279 RepID=UPI00178280FF|nr:MULTISPECIES: hypothetical protein [unclassified Massilia]MBD8532937.1 hypothetical protein [Massilia sp. CFBP 13647]MBD8676300.1 hypothetical protein [Massilia sp. CFBP 13721]